MPDFCGDVSLIFSHELEEKNITCGRPVCNACGRVGMYMPKSWGGLPHVVTLHTPNAPIASASSNALLCLVNWIPEHQSSASAASI